MHEYADDPTSTGKAGPSAGAVRTVGDMASRRLGHPAFLQDSGSAPEQGRSEPVSARPTAATGARANAYGWTA